MLALVDTPQASENDTIQIIFEDPESLLSQVDREAFITNSQRAIREILELDLMPDLVYQPRIKVVSVDKWYEIANLVNMTKYGDKLLVNCKRDEKGSFLSIALGKEGKIKTEGLTDEELRMYAHE